MSTKTATLRSTNAAAISDSLCDADAVLQALQSLFTTAQDLNIGQSMGISIIIDGVREKLKQAEEKL